MTSRIMTRRDGSEVVEAWGNRPRRIEGFRDTSCRRRAIRRRSGWLRGTARSGLRRAGGRLLTSRGRLLMGSLR